VAIQYAYDSNVAAGNLTLSGGITLSSTSTLDAVRSGGLIDVTGAITGAGGLNIASSASSGGVVRLSAANTYTGATNVTDGTLSLGHATNTLSSSSAVTVDGAKAVLSIAGNSDTVGAVSLKNGGSITGSGGTLTGASYAVESGSVSAILGGTSIALTKSTAGTVTLSGANSYTGATTVSGGKLSIASTGNISTTSGISIGAAELNYNSSTALTNAITFSTTGGKLSGNGTITPATTISAGNTLAPGNSIGTLSFGSGLTIAGTYSVELGTAGATAASGLSDRAAVTGDLTLTGSTLELVDNAGANSQGSAGAGAYRIATFTGTRTGTFGTVTNPFSSLREVVSYGTGVVDLSLYNAAAANTLSAVNLGKIRAGGSFGTTALTITNTAAAGSYTEGLNATMGNVTGSATVSGINISDLSGLASSTAISVGLGSGNMTAGAYSGNVSIDFASNGTASGLSDLGLNSQSLTVTGAVYDYATADFTQTAGVGALTKTNTYSYTFNFGSGLALSTNYTATFSLANGALNVEYKDALGGSYSVIGNGFSTTAGAFGTNTSNSLAAGGSNSFDITFNSGTGGLFNETLTFSGLSQQSGLADASLGNYTFALSAVAIPEPDVAVLLGGLGMLTLLRRRRA
jgi:autotransporter-associated beta strand protein